MRSVFKKYILLLFLLSSLIACIKQYAPPAVVSANNNYLVVDGFINAGPNESSSFILSRTRNLGDTSTVDVPELNATISIVSQLTGATFPLTDSNNTGVYNSASLNLNTADEYQLKINTTNGDHYLSDFVPVKISAPIDSVTWQQDNNNNIDIFVNTHDPANSSIYYKWDFVETWEHDAVIAAYFLNINGNLMLSSLATPEQQIDSCWSSAESNTLITGTSAALAQDVIREQPVTTILQNDPKLAIRYSVNVRQIPLTLAAFNYWSLIEKNSQQLGTLFNPQPSQLPSNIHSSVNPNEAVIGYISAASPQENRLFISSAQISNWNAPPPLSITTSCPMIDFPYVFPIYNYPDTTYAPITTISNANLVIVTKKECVDCAAQGGTTTRPSFW